MDQATKRTNYDLMDRTFTFAQNVRKLVKELPRTASNLEDVKQIVRSSGSIGANYIEANEALSRKDFLLRIKICRKEAKEAKETNYWLRLLNCGAKLSVDETRGRLVLEAMEYVRIFNAILVKSQ